MQQLNLIAIVRAAIKFNCNSATAIPCPLIFVPAFFYPGRVPASSGVMSSDGMESLGALLLVYGYVRWDLTEPSD